MPISTLKNIYFSFVQSHLTYGLIVWGSATTSIINTIQKQQNKCIRLMTLSKKNGFEPDINFTNLKLLNINQHSILEICKLIYNYHQDIIPDNLKQLFKPSKGTHNHGT